MESLSAYIYTYGYSRVTQVDDEVTQCICMYGYSQVTHIDDEVTQCLHTHMVRSWVRFTKFGFPNGSTPPPPRPPPWSTWKPLSKKHEKYSCECCLWRCMSSGLAVSHFSLTTRHCEWEAFSFTMNTLRKCDCLEVKVKSGCCVKKKKKGRGWRWEWKWRMVNWTHFGYHLWTWTVDAPCAPFILVNWTHFGYHLWTWTVDAPCAPFIFFISSGSPENQNHVIVEIHERHTKWQTVPRAEEHRVPPPETNVIACLIQW